MERSITDGKKGVYKKYNKETVEHFLAENFFSKVNAMYYREIELVLNSLKLNEAFSIILRHGLWNGKPMKLEEIGNLLGITRERTRQTIAKGMRKLKHPSRLEPLRMVSEGIPLITKKSL